MQYIAFAQTKEQTRETAQQLSELRFTNKVTHEMHTAVKKTR